ncbi:FH2 domain-containing protein 1 [Trichinella britovi]|uniref:FH2 domain-containing protein 1 n=1 Tax=Trichinella britovi TaxID=45882 RepID=A0A0V1CHD8_TRIBR|nr:FH2 domain-containing protein 1 [Trichinella britovi]
MRIDGLEASDGEDFHWLNTETETEEENGEIVNCPFEQQNVDAVSRRDDCGVSWVYGTKHEPLFNRFLQYLAVIVDCDALNATFTRTESAPEELNNIFWNQLESFLSIFESAKSNIQMTSAVDNSNSSNNNNNKQEAPNKTTVLPPPPPPPPLLSSNCGSTSKHNINNNNNNNNNHTLPCRNRESRFSASSGQWPSTDASTTEDDLTQTSGGLCCAKQHRPLDNDHKLKPETECKHGEAAALFPKLPTPKIKLKTLPWHKIPLNKVIKNGNNIWVQGAKRFDASWMPDFNMLEQLFAADQRTNSSLMNTHLSNGSAAGSDFVDPCTSNIFDDSIKTKYNRTMSSTTERRRKEAVEINLLDPKRSININIFLKQFRGGVEELANLIRCDRADEIGSPEKLRGMIKILPDQDEMAIIEGFTGDRTKLGDAEKFFLYLREIPYYRIRVETMLLKSEFATIIEGMKSSLEIMLRAAREVLKSRALPDLLCSVLLVGNYLNLGVYSGNACGFRLVSLWNLVDVRANLPNMTLIHYFAAEAEKKNQKLLSFCEELPHVEEASKIPLDILYADYRSMQERTRKVSHQVSKCDKELLEQVEKFVECLLLFEHASKELSDVGHLLKQLDNLRIQLAEFFCEDLHSFKLDEAFKVIANFQQRFKKALQENYERLTKELKNSNRQRNAPDCTTESQFDGKSKSNSRMAENPAKLSNSSDLALQDVLKHEENQPEKVNLGCYWGLSSRRSNRQKALWLASDNCRERPKFPTSPTCLQSSSTKITSCNSLLSEYEQKAKSDSNHISVGSGSSSHSLSSERIIHHVEEEKKIFKSTCAISMDCLGRKYSTGCGNFEKEIISADLNGFLELLELEKEQMENSLYGRRYKNTRKEENFPIPPFDIDEVVRQCEETCVEIDQLGIEPDAGTKNNDDNQEKKVGTSHSHSSKQNHRDLLSSHKTASSVRPTTCSTVQQKHSVSPDLREATNSGLVGMLKSLKSDKCSTTSAANRTNSGVEYGHDGKEGFETASLSTVSSDRLTPVGRNAENAVEVKMDSQGSKIAASKLGRGSGAKYLKPTKSSTAKTAPSVKVDPAAKVKLPLGRRNAASSTPTRTTKSTACQQVSHPIAQVSGTKEKSRLRPAVMADKTSNNSMKLSNSSRQNVFVRKREGATWTTTTTTTNSTSRALTVKSQATESVVKLASVRNNVVGGRASVSTALKRADENSSVILQKPKCVPASHSNTIIKEPTTNRNCNDKRLERLKSLPKSTLNLLGQSKSVSRNRNPCPDNSNLKKPNSTTGVSCKKTSLPPWR